MIQIPIEGGPNPFAILSFIVAPAILTNASAVVAMSTSTRLARAVDRARELSKQLEGTEKVVPGETDRRLKELGAAEERALLLIQALQSFYTAMGGFAAAALLSVFGAVLVSLGVDSLIPAFEIVAVVTGFVAVGALVHGSVVLVRETRLAVHVLRERAQGVRSKMGYILDGDFTEL